MSKQTGKSVFFKDRTSLLLMYISFILLIVFIIFNPWHDGSEAYAKTSSAHTHIKTIKQETQA